MSAHKDEYHLPAAVQARLAGAIRDYRTKHQNAFIDDQLNAVVTAVIIGLTAQISATVIHEEDAAAFRASTKPLTDDSQVALTTEQHERATV